MSENSTNNALYVDNSTKKVKKTKTVKKQIDQNEVEIVAKNKPENLTKTDDSKTQEKLKEEKSKNLAPQLDMFSELGEISVNYKKAKVVVKKFLEKCVGAYDTFSKQNNKLSFNKKQMLKVVNEYVQSLVVAKELSKNGFADENNMQFALDVSWFGNVFEGIDNLDALKSLVKTKLLEVPYVFMISVILDIREGLSLSVQLYGELKKMFMEIYPEGSAEFEILTKPIVNFLAKQGITV